MKANLLFILLCMFNGFLAQNWQQLDDFPSASRDDAVVFTIGNKAYCGTGQTPWFEPASNFYSFDMNLYEWNKTADLPTTNGRQYASSFENDTLGFLFGGVNNEFFNDLYAYDPLQDSWEQKTSLPAEARSGSASFRIGDKAYIVGGRTENEDFINEVWEYNIPTDEWTQKNDFPFGKRWRMNGASNDTLGYIIFGLGEGSTYSKGLYEYNPSSDTWSTLTEFPESPRNYASMIFLNNQLIVLFGMDENGKYYNDVHLYNLATDEWEVGDTLPDLPRRGGLVFSSGLDLFYSTGLVNTPERTSETWMLQNPTNSLVDLTLEKLSIYPNPASNVLIIKCENCKDKPQKVILKTIQGQHVSAHEVEDVNMQIDVSALNSGTYFILIENKNNQQYKPLRFVKL